MKKIWVALALTLLSLHSLTVIAEPLTIVGKDKKVAMTLPDGWTQRESAVGSGQLSAVNAAQHTYVLLISEAKEDFQDIEHYGKIVAEAMAKRLEKSTLSEPVKIEVSGQPAMRYELMGFSDGASIGYDITIVETATRFNQVISWGLRSVYKQFKPSLQELAKGLKELP